MSPSHHTPNIQPDSNTGTLRKHRTTIVSILTLTLARMVINMPRRFPYPFVSTIAGQLHVSVSSVQSVMAFQSGIGLSSPIFGPFSEAYGRKRVMMGGLLLVMLSSFLALLVPGFWVFVLVMLLAGIGKIIFDPAIQAYVGDRIPYNRRGMAMGTVELSWALSLLLIAPVAGFLLATSQPSAASSAFLSIIGYDLPIHGFLADSGGLRLIFGLFVALSGSVLLLVWLLIPPDHPGRDTKKQGVTPLDTIRIMRRSPTALAAIGYAFALSTANEIFFINYGVWMERSFGLALATIGIATTVVAAAEVSGEVTVIVFADRFGKRRLALWGSLVAALCYLLVPLLAASTGSALIGLFIMFLGTETAIVAAFPLFTELLPESRAVMLSSAAAAFASARLTGDLIGGLLLSISGDFVLIGLIAMVIGLIATLTIMRLIPVD